ncbi:UL7 [anatid alphaherpesvirus 1]|nr:UL7 [Anatid alphaherpesvirus 1]
MDMNQSACIMDGGTQAVRKIMNYGTNHPLEDSATLNELVKLAASGNEKLGTLVDDISWQAIPRLMCEVREVPGIPTRFTGASVMSLRVNSNNLQQLYLQLTGSSNSIEVPSNVYHTQCLAQTAFRGFAFAVITTAEDRVQTLAVPPIILKHRMTIFKPSEHLDFALCLVIMFLENCPRERICSSLFVQLHTFIRKAWSTVTVMTKMRRLLCIGATWLLNTLMLLSGREPFDPKHVLPNHAIIRQLSILDEPPAVLAAIYTAKGGKKFDLPSDVQKCPSDAIVIADGVLNEALKCEWIRDAIYDWWISQKKKLTGEQLYYTY